tara:strand:+ start:147 stop:335 length:189 start_codon:yes stop_codon:yes gene_type:complete
MDKWQLIFLNFAIAIFFLQILLIILVYPLSKLFSKEKDDRELLEQIFKQPSLSNYYIKNLKS